MQRLALAFALGAVIAAALPSPGLFLALGLGLLAIGTGWVGYGQRAAPGFARLAAAAAITIGGLGFLLGAVRVILALAAIDHLRGIVG
jgi:hypothetical protein